MLSVVPWCQAFLLFYWDIFCMIFRWYHLPLLLLVTFVFAFYMCCISIARSLYFKNISSASLSHFYLQKLQCLFTRHVPFSLSRTMGCSSLLGMGLSVFICWFHNIVILRSLLVSTNFGACAYQSPFPNFILISLYIVKWSWTHSLSCLFMYCFCVNIGRADIVWRIVWTYCLL